MTWHVIGACAWFFLLGAVLGLWRGDRAARQAWHEARRHVEAMSASIDHVAYHRGLRAAHAAKLAEVRDGRAIYALGIINANTADERRSREKEGTSHDE